MQGESAHTCGVANTGYAKGADMYGTNTYQVTFTTGLSMQVAAFDVEGARYIAGNSASLYVADWGQIDTVTEVTA